MFKKICIVYIVCVYVYIYNIYIYARSICALNYSKSKLLHRLLVKASRVLVHLGEIFELFVFNNRCCIFASLHMRVPSLPAHVAQAGYWLMVSAWKRKTTVCDWLNRRWRQAEVQQTRAVCKKFCILFWNMDQNNGKKKTAIIMLDQKALPIFLGDSNVRRTSILIV